MFFEGTKAGIISHKSDFMTSPGADPTVFRRPAVRRKMDSYFYFRIPSRPLFEESFTGQPAPHPNLT